MSFHATRLAACAESSSSASTWLPLDLVISAGQAIYREDWIFAPVKYLAEKIVSEMVCSVCRVEP